MPLISPHSFHTTVYCKKTNPPAISEYEEDTKFDIENTNNFKISKMNDNRKERALNQLKNLINQDDKKENGIKLVSLLAKIKYQDNNPSANPEGVLKLLEGEDNNPLADSQENVTQDNNPLANSQENLTEELKLKNTCKELDINLEDVMEFTKNRNSCWIKPLPRRMKELISVVGIENLEVDRDCKDWLAQQGCELFPTSFMPPLIDIEYLKPIDDMTSRAESKNDDDDDDDDDETKSCDKNSFRSFGREESVNRSSLARTNSEFKANARENYTATEVNFTPRNATIFRNRAILLNKINKKLISDTLTRNCFKMLLTPPIVNSRLNPSARIAEINHLLRTNEFTIALGDGDGSIAREILTGIWAGVVDLDAEGINTLIELMQIETTTLQKENYKDRSDDKCYFRNFQQDQAVKKLIQNLKAQIRYNHAITRVVVGGDNVHDRLSSEKKICAEIREKLHAHGVIYIAGNHEDAREMIEKATIGMYEQAGIWADLSENSKIQDTCAQDFDKIEYSQKNEIIKNIQQAKNNHYTPAVYKFWDNHRKKVFQNAHYDETTNTLYCHHGIKQIGINLFLTAFGPIQARTPAELARKMNGRSFIYNENNEFIGIKCPAQGDRLQTINNCMQNSQILNERLLEIYSIYFTNFRTIYESSKSPKYYEYEQNYFFSSTEFRPEDNEMIDTRLNDHNPLFNSLTIVHGHNADSNVNDVMKESNDNPETKENNQTASSTHKVINVNSRMERNNKRIYQPVMGIIRNKKQKRKSESQQHKKLDPNKFIFNGGWIRM